MYNPYNWKIVKRDDDIKMGMNMPIFPGEMTRKSSCILNELALVSFKRDLKNIEVTKILEEINNLKSEIDTLEGFLDEKLIEMSELDEKIIEISHSLPVFER